MNNKIYFSDVTQAGRSKCVNLIKILNYVWF